MFSIFVVCTAWPAGLFLGLSEPELNALTDNDVQQAVTQLYMAR